MNAEFVPNVAEYDCTTKTKVFNLRYVIEVDAA